MPVWGEGDLLFCSSAYDGGSRLIKLSKVSGKTVATQLWHTNRIRVHIGSIVRIGDYLYASSGDFGPAFVTALHVHTGKVAWRRRGFAKANVVYADGKLILLDEDGRLALATVSPEGLKVSLQGGLAEEQRLDSSLLGRQDPLRPRQKNHHGPGLGRLTQ